MYRFDTAGCQKRWRRAQIALAASPAIAGLAAIALVVPA
jgi:hypothetical protein